MALIHEELHKGQGFEMLNFSSYVKKLADNLLLIYRLGSNNINLNMDLDQNVFFNMDTAVPLGIIINELVSNSLKHAFPNRNIGEIRIKLHREEGSDTIFILIVSDNGVVRQDYAFHEDRPTGRIIPRNSVGDGIADISSVRCGFPRSVELSEITRTDVRKTPRYAIRTFDRPAGAQDLYHAYRREHRSPQDQA